MEYTVIVLISLIVGAGLIAYIGDLLGRKMGKARLTLFGLRPRHTAVLVTTVTGMIIATLTLSLVLAANKNFRKVLVKGQQILAQNVRLQTENTKLSGDQVALRKHVAKMQSDEQDARQALELAQKALAGANSTLARAKSDLTKANLTHTQLSAQIAAQQRELRGYSARLTQEKHNLAVARTAAWEAGKQMMQYQKQYMKVRDMADVQQLGYGQLRLKRVIFSPGEEVARGVIQPADSLPVLRWRIMNILEEASDNALKQGAVRGQNGRAVVIIPKIIRDPATGKQIRFRESDSVEAIAQNMLDDPKPRVVQVIAQSNSIKGEQTVVEVHVHSDLPAFSRGQVLGCLDINASTSYEEISEAVRQFLAGQVRDAAIKAGMIPRVKDNGDTVYFELSLDKLVGLVNRIKDAGGTVRLCAKAAGNITTAGPLELQFTIQRT